jgi:hypothetical protein
MSSLVRVTMTGGARGAWQVTRMRSVAGKGPADVNRLSVVESLSASLPQEGEKERRLVTARLHEERRLGPRSFRIGKLEPLRSMPCSPSTNTLSRLDDKRFRSFASARLESRGGLLRGPGRDLCRRSVCAAACSLNRLSRACEAVTQGSVFA